MHDFFLTAFKLQLKRLLKARVFILSILLIILIFIFLGALFDERGSNITINVGILFDDSSMLSNDIYRTLSGNSVLSLFPFDVDQKEQFENDVMSSRLECGYILDVNIDEKIRTGDFSGLIYSVSSPVSVATGIVDEAVAAALIRSITPIVSVDFISDKLKITDTGYLEKDIRVLIDSYFEDEIFTKVNFLSNSSDMNVSVQSAHINEFAKFDVKWILHGVIALFCIVICLFNAATFIDELNSAACVKITSKIRVLFLFANMCANMVLNVIYMSLCLVFLSVLFDYSIYSLESEVITLVIYSAVLASFEFFLSSILKKADLIFSSFPVVVVSLILFGGVFFNLTEVNQVFYRVSFFFLPYHYLTALNNSFLSNDAYYLFKGCSVMLLFCLALAFCGVIAQCIKNN